MNTNERPHLVIVDEATGLPKMSDGLPHPHSPEWGDYCQLFNDVTRALSANLERPPLFSARKRIIDDLWRAGYRKAES